jgi:hypothetical protein
MPKMVLVSEVYRVFYHKARIARAFLITLIELASLLVVTRTSLFFTVEHILGLALVKLVVLIYMASTSVLAIFLLMAISRTWHCCNTTSGIHNQCLFLSLRTKENIDIEVLQLCAVSIKV